jgi:3D (Asp-Asp-Asp) domain-containing protein
MKIKIILLVFELFISLPLKTAGVMLGVVKLPKEKEEIIDGITLTTYKAISAETDSTPLITASGFKIKPNKAREHRIIAVSRDLKKRFKWGDKVRIKGAGKYNGEYRVHDLMNKRYKKRIDVLIGGGDKPTKIRNIKISPIKLEDSSK